MCLNAIAVSLDSLKRAAPRHVIGNQFAADWPLRVIAEASAHARLTTRAEGAKGKSHEELQRTAD
jgi:hypothetical protein